MIEEQVEIEVAVADLQPILTAHEGEATSKFDQKGLDVCKQAGFELALMEGLFQRQEVEEIGVFQQPLSKRGVGLGQRGGEV